MGQQILHCKTLIDWGAFEPCMYIIVACKSSNYHMCLMDLSVCVSVCVLGWFLIPYLSRFIDRSAHVGLENLHILSQGFLIQKCTEVCSHFPKVRINDQCRSQKHTTVKVKRMATQSRGLVAKVKGAVASG